MPSPGDTYTALGLAYADPLTRASCVRLTDDGQSPGGEGASNWFQDMSGEQSLGSCWAPDSIHICYAKGVFAGTTKVDGIYMLNTTTFVETLLYEITTDVSRSYPVWSRDGSNEVYFYEVVGSNIRIRAVLAEAPWTARTIATIASNHDHQKLGINADFTLITAHVRPPDGSRYRTIIAQINGGGILSNWTLSGPPSADGSVWHPSNPDVLVASRDQGQDWGYAYNINTLVPLHTSGLKLSHSAAHPDGSSFLQITSPTYVNLNTGVTRFNDGGQGAFHPRFCPADISLGDNARVAADEATFYHNPIPQPLLWITTIGEMATRPASGAVWRYPGREACLHFSNSSNNLSHPGAIFSPNGERLVWASNKRANTYGAPPGGTGGGEDLFMLYVGGTIVTPGDPPPPPPPPDPDPTLLGTVEFFNGVTSLGTAPIINGEAVLVLPAGTLATGTHALTAVASGDTFDDTTSPEHLHSVAAAAANVVTITLEGTPNPSSFGDEVALVARVSAPGGDPVGDVEFYDSFGALIDTVTVVDGAASTTVDNLAPGLNILTAVFVPDDDEDFTSATSDTAIMVVSPDVDPASWPVDFLATQRQECYYPLWLLILGDMDWVQVSDDWIQEDMFQLAPGGFRRFVYGQDLDALPDFYDGRILRPPTVTRKLRETNFGTLEISDVVVELNNADLALLDWYTEDARAIPMRLVRYDRDSGLEVAEFTGRVQQVELAEGRLILTGVNVDTSIFAAPLPMRQITTTQFPRALDVGLYVSIVFGNVPKVPLRYINDDTSTNLYDYLVGEGALTVDAVYRDGPNDTLYLVNPDEYVVSTTLYPGMTVVRFTTRQTNFQDALHLLFADVTGLQNERNFARAVRSVLSNSVWGMRLNVDATSFTIAETAIAALGEFYCDGAILEPPDVQDLLRQLLLVRGMRLGLNQDAQWTLAVDTFQISYALRAERGPEDGERTLIECGPLAHTPLDEQVSTYRLHYRLDLMKNEYIFNQTRVVHPTYGQERTLEHPFIRTHRTADKVVHYLAARLQYGKDTLEVMLSQEARELTEGMLLLVTNAAIGLDGVPMEVRSITKGLDTIEALLASWDPAIYAYTGGTLPDDDVAGSFTDYSRIPPSPVSGLSVVELGTELAADGSTSGYATIEYTTPEVNFAHAIVRIRRTGTTPWLDGAIVSPQTGTVQVRLNGLTTGATYDITVQAVNMFGLVSSGDPVL
jgi:hypothetical protein